MGQNRRTRLGVVAVALAIPVMLGSSAESAAPLLPRPAAKSGADTPATTPRVSVRLDDGRLTVVAEAAPLFTVLSEIGRVAAVATYIESGLAGELERELISVHIAGASLEQAAKRLLAARSYTLVLEAGGPAELRVYRDGTSPYRRLAAPAARPAHGARAGKSSPVPPANAAVLVATLTEAALTSRHAAERIRALERLSSMAEEETVRETALAVLRRDGDPEVMGMAVEVLGHQAAPPVHEVLDLFRRSADPALRIRVLDFLQEHGNGHAGVREAVERLVRTETSEEVMANARDLLDGVVE